MNSLSLILSQIRSRLEGRTETPGLDAQVLLEHIAGRPRSWVLAHPEAVLSPVQQENLARALARLEQGEPLPYVLGAWEFFGLDFMVTPATLIPRPETELLVERALEWLRLHPGRRFAVDIGTGTGCIAISLAVNNPEVRLLACDLSLEALRVAHANLRHHRVQERVLCVQADLLPGTGQRVDLICANLPYIPSATLQNLPVRRWEPPLALDGGSDGLSLVRRLLEQVPDALATGGLALLEIEETQGEVALQLARMAVGYSAAGHSAAAHSALAHPTSTQSGVELLHDLAGRPRLICIQA